MRAGRKYVIGVDEAGRGPLAGPITVAAIKIAFKISPETNMPYKNDRKYMADLELLKNIKDSKKLSAKQRQEWLEILRKNFEYKIAMVGPKVIDKIGIQKATRLAVARVIRKLQRPAGSLRVLLDGSLFAPRHYNQRTIIKGDEKIPLIAAASIIAKTSRDVKMLRLHKKFPKYCFDKHKGYATKLHYKMLRKNSLCPIHRRSFCKRVICRNLKFKIK